MNFNDWLAAMPRKPSRPYVVQDAMPRLRRFYDEGLAPAEARAAMAVLNPGVWRPLAEPAAYKIQRTRWMHT
jgi:hypothetical protein